jgi:hypothetical protein
LTLFGMYGSQHFGLKGSYSFAIGFFFWNTEYKPNKNVGHNTQWSDIQRINVR